MTELKITDDGKIILGLAKNKESADAFVEHIKALEAEVKGLKEAIKGALAIKNLWLPEDCLPEHEEEMKALQNMKTVFAKLLAPPEGGNDE